MHGVELFHQFSSRILQNVSLCPDRQTDSMDQDQTVQSDVGFTLSLGYIFVKGQNAVYFFCIVFKGASSQIS